MLATCVNRARPKLLCVLASRTLLAASCSAAGPGPGGWLLHWQTVAVGAQDPNHPIIQDSRHVEGGSPRLCRTPCHCQWVKMQWGVPCPPHIFHKLINIPIILRRALGVGGPASASASKWGGQTPVRPLTPRPPLPVAVLHCLHTVRCAH